jgi:hypothetical protein
VHSKIFHRLWRKLKRGMRPFYVAMNFRTVFGPRRLHIDADQFIVVCMVKDGEYFVRKFLEHYAKLGARHIVFIDNGSTDETIALATQFPNVTVLRCLLPAKVYESEMRRHAANIFCQGGGWCLFADMDEYFDYPGRDKVTLTQILQYLNRHEYSAVLGQMLDMYPVGELTENDGDVTSGSFVETHCYYETDSLKYVDYHAPENLLVYFLKENKIADPQLRCFYGGVRSRVFGTNNWLTKHPLVRILPGVTASTHPHCSSGVSCADFSVLLKHYKFAGDFAKRMQREVAAKTWDNGEAEGYLQRVNEQSTTFFLEGTSKRYTTAEQVVDNNFVYASYRFMEWLETAPVPKSTHRQL